MLSSAPVLETPEAYATFIRDDVQPVRNRRLHVEILESTFDWKQFLAMAHLKVAGLAATHRQPHTCHVWRLVARKHITKLGFTFASIECMHKDWE